MGSTMDMGILDVGQLDVLLSTDMFLILDIFELFEDVDEGCKSDDECVVVVEVFVCIIVVCNEDGICSIVLVAEGIVCDDFNICTENDVCLVDGVCAGMVIDGCEKGCDWVIDLVFFDFDMVGDECVFKVSLFGVSISNGQFFVGFIIFNFSFLLGELFLDLVIFDGCFIGDVAGVFDLNDG